MEKPNAPSCEKNREVILDVLRQHFADRHHVLEIGSGTGQHAIFFAEYLPHLTWQTSDRAENLPGITAWLDEAALPNTPPPCYWMYRKPGRPDATMRFSRLTPCISCPGSPSSPCSPA